MKTRTKLIAAAATAAASAAGYYFFASKKAKTNRKVVADWASDMKVDVMKQARQLKKIDRSTLAGVVDSVLKAYKGVRNLDQKDVMRAGNELKDNWQKLQQELMQTSVLAKKEAEKTISDARQTVRKTAKKVTSKVRKAIA